MLEEKYATLAADQMNVVPNPEGDQIDPVTEEFKLVQTVLTESVTKLVRQFSKRENVLLLETYGHKTKAGEESEI